jgi:hypothetical protein
MITVKKCRTSLAGRLSRRLLLVTVFTTIATTSVVQAQGLLDRIAWCESQGHQFDGSGRVLRNRFNPAVVGVFQINEHYHGVAARRLGYNIYTLAGNWAYATWLLKNAGSAPWLASEHCWKVAAQ